MLHPTPFSLISGVQELPVQVCYLVDLSFHLVPVFAPKRVNNTVMALISVVGILSDLIFKSGDSGHQLLLLEQGAVSI